MTAGAYPADLQELLELVPPLSPALGVRECNVLHRALPSLAGAQRDRAVALLLDAVGGVVTNEVARLLKTRGGSTFRDGRLASFEDLANEAWVHLLAKVLGDYDLDHPRPSWPAYAQKRVHAHLRDVARIDEYDGALSNRELTALVAVNKRLDRDPDVDTAPTGAQLRAAVDDHLDEAVSGRMERDGLSFEQAHRRAQRNSEFRVGGEFLKLWETFTRRKRSSSLDDQVRGEDGSATLGDLVSDGAARVDDVALDGLESPSFEELVHQMLTAGVEQPYLQVFEEMVEQRCAPEREDDGRGEVELGRATVAGAVRDALEVGGDQVGRTAKAVRHRRATVQRRAGSPHGQWAFLAAELPGQLVGDWPADA